MQTNPGSHITTAKVLGPDGNPWQEERGYDVFDIPHVLTFNSILNNAWRTYSDGGHDDALRNDEEFADAMARDPHLLRLLREREDAVISMKWHLETDDERNSQHKAVKDGVTACLNLTPRLQTMLRYLSKAVYIGRYGAQLDYEWQIIDVPDPQNPRQRIPTRAPAVLMHNPMHGDKILHHHDRTPYVKVMSSRADDIPNAQITLAPKSKGVDLVGSLRAKFILHQHEVVDAPFNKPERGEGIFGVGIRSMVYWASWLRKELMASILEYCERMGLGLRIWYYDPANPASKTAVENAAKLETNKTNLLVPRTVNHMGKSAEAVEFVETGSNGAMFLREIMNDFKADIELLVIGQTLSSGTEGSGLGGTGVAGMHADTKHKIISLDANNLAETLTMDWVKPVLGWMYPRFRGMPLRWVFETSSPNQAEQIDGVVKLYNIGVDFVTNEVRALTGMSDPQEGDQTISLAAQMQQQAAMQPQIPGDGDSDGVPNEDEEPTDDDYAELMAMTGA